VMAPTLAPTRPTTWSLVKCSPRCRMRGPRVQARRILSRTRRMRNRSHSRVWATRCIQLRYQRPSAREVTSLNRIASIRIYLWPRTDCGSGGLGDNKRTVTSRLRVTRGPRSGGGRPMCDPPTKRPG
jgi:hypothetical protein